MKGHVRVGEKQNKEEKNRTKDTSSGFLLFHRHSPYELGVESTPSLTFPSLPWAFRHSVLMNYFCQPVSAAILQHVAVQEDQLALRSVEPVVIRIGDGDGPLKAWCDRQNRKETFGIR